MSSKDFGLGPKWWQRRGNKLQKCAERKSEWCDPTETDGCCAVIACTYCLELEAYGGGIKYGTADFATEGWEGTVNGNSFFGYWEKNYDGICEFIVVFNGAEVYRESCEGGQSCRDSSDETEVVVDYEDYTLRWIKHEPLPLPYIDDPDSGCKTWFCGVCECSCNCLCVTITEPNSTVTTGEICNSAYECQGPRWEGTIGYYDLALTLARDSYGNCILESMVNGEAQDAVAVTGCKDMTATITLYDGTTIVVACKICACEEAVSLCCGGRDLAGTLYLKLVYPGTSAVVECGDTLLTLADAGDGNWYGSTTVLAEVPGGGDEECVPFTAHFWFYCDPAGPVYQLAWYFEYLGVRTPLADWCGLAKSSEDCDYPYLASWAENEDCSPGFWNGFYTFLVSEVAI